MHVFICVFRQHRTWVSTVNNGKDNTTITAKSKSKWKLLEHTIMMYKLGTLWYLNTECILSLKSKLTTKTDLEMKSLQMKNSAGRKKTEKYCVADYVLIPQKKACLRLYSINSLNKND